MKKRALLIVAVMLLTTAVASVAGAAPPSCDDNPDHPRCTETVMVTMAYEGAGIATTATCGGEALPMVRSEPEFLRYDFESVVPGPEVLMVQMAGLPGVADGCHGGLVAGSAEGSFAGMIWLEGGGDGVRLYSRFDYTWQQGSHPNPRKTSQYLVDFYEMDGLLSGDFDWSTGGTLAGDLSVRRFDKADGVWYESEPSSVAVTITVNIS